VHLGSTDRHGEREASSSIPKILVREPQALTHHGDYEVTSI